MTCRPPFAIIITVGKSSTVHVWPCSDCSTKNNQPCEFIRKNTPHMQERNCWVCVRRFSLRVPLWSVHLQRVFVPLTFTVNSAPARAASVSAESIPPCSTVEHVLIQLRLCSLSLCLHILLQSIHRHILLLPSSSPHFRRST